jgi:hypothetical protein
MADSVVTFELPLVDDKYVRRFFVATQRIVPDQPPFPDNAQSDDDLRRLATALWDESLEGMRAEHARMRRASLYYDGFHYDNPEDNFNNEVTNYPFSLVETIWAEMVEAVPRPEVQAASGLSDDRARTLNEFYTWLMNTSGFDYCNRVGTREMLTLGWNIDLITIDHHTGMPYPKPWSNWHFYPDATADHEDSMMHYFLAGPVNTRMLRHIFPRHAKSIVPDHYKSPAYDVLIQPYRDAIRPSDGIFESGPRVSLPVYGQSFDQGSQSYYGSDSAPSGSQIFTQASDGGRPDRANTTYLFQLFLRDQTTMPVGYFGVEWACLRSGEWVQSQGTLVVHEPVCENGWRVVQLDSSGTVLDVGQLDRCFNGMNITMGRAYERAGRMFNCGEIDNIIPKTRSINRRTSLLNAALELTAIPTILMDKDSGVSPDKAAFAAGEIIRKTRGSDIKYLELRGPSEGQYMMLQRSAQDIDVISGVHDVMQGQRPPGIEAGVAIARLQNQGKTRIRGKERGQFARYKSLLQKMGYVAALKMQRPLIFRGTRGQPVSVTPEDILNEHDIQFVPGTGLASTRLDQRAEAMNLFQIGAIDLEALLDAIDWKDRDKVLMRQREMQMMKMMIEAEAAKSAGAQNGSKSAA